MTKNYTGSIADSAVNSAPVSLLQLILRKISRRVSLARARRQLMALDDRMLKDIGLTRPDIKGNFWDSSRRNRAASNPRRSSLLEYGLSADLIHRRDCSVAPVRFASGI